MIHEELAHVLKEEMGLVHGVDFLAAHMICKETDQPEGEAFIMRWMNKDVPEPTLDEIAALKVKYETVHYVSFAAKKAREARDFQMSNSDWTQNPDVPSAVREKWKEHRQALRDISDQPGFPLTIDWPVAPA